MFQAGEFYSVELRRSTQWTGVVNTFDSSVEALANDKGEFILTI